MVELRIETADDLLR